MKFDQDLCATCDMNSALGSVVPLAMFLKIHSCQCCVERETFKCVVLVMFCGLCSNRLMNMII